MSVGLVGRKCGMTRIFTEEGSSIPVTVVEVIKNHLTQLKTEGKDGYTAVQICSGAQKPSLVNKPMSGHYAKAGVAAGKSLHEFRLKDEKINGKSFGECNLGDSLTVDLFSEGQKVNVRGTTKGKGFAGVVKRYNFRMQDATHGNSLSHRAPGSIGQCQTPGRVFKGKKMAGQMGNVKRMARNLVIVKIDIERSLLMIKGAVPGAPGGEVVVTLANEERGEG